MFSRLLNVFVSPSSIHDVLDRCEDDLRKLPSPQIALELGHLREMLKRVRLQGAADRLMLRFAHDPIVMMILSHRFRRTNKGLVRRLFTEACIRQRLEEGRRVIWEGGKAV